MWHSAQGEEFPLYAFESTKIAVLMVMCRQVIMAMLALATIQSLYESR